MNSASCDEGSWACVLTSGAPPRMAITAPIAAACTGFIIVLLLEGGQNGRPNCRPRSQSNRLDDGTGRSLAGPRSGVGAVYQQQLFLAGNHPLRAGRRDV